MGHGGVYDVCCWGVTQIKINGRSLYRKHGLMSNRPQRVFLDNVIFYTLNDLSMLFSDAKFALLPCHFQSGAHHDFARGCIMFSLSTF